MSTFQPRVRWLIIILALSGILSWCAGTKPYIDVVYPRPREFDGKVVITKVDSNFIFGSVQPSDASLTINGNPVTLYSNGAFLAFLPVPKNDQTYYLHAESGGEGKDISLSFLFPDQLEPDTLTITQFNCPTVIRFLPGNNVTRNHVLGAYDLFPLEDTRCIALGQQNEYLKIRLTSTRFTWAETRFVEELPTAPLPGIRVVNKITCESGNDYTSIVIPDIGHPIFRLEDFLDPNEIRLTLYRVQSHIDLIRLNKDDPILRSLLWEQIEDGVLVLHLYLKHASWGYKAQWIGDALEIQVKHPPDLSDGLQGITVGIDPGHGGDQYGAVGPTRFAEKDLNMLVALDLCDRLASVGATAVLIRRDDETLGLYERIDRAEEAGADLLISIHHNAFADGVNPFLQPCGTGTYYYRPQSIAFARHVHEYLLKATDLPDDGLFYDNLALIRPTQFPSVLVEIAYLMMPDQEEQLRKSSYRKRYVKALYRGINSYIKARRKELR